MTTAATKAGGQNLPPFFREIWACDFEYIAAPGTLPVPVCAVFKELRSGRVIRIWQDEFGPAPPFATNTETLFVSFNAPAELRCFEVLGWPMPQAIVCLYAEFRLITNGRSTIAGRNLIGALTHYGIHNIGADEKRDMIALILGRGPWTDVEREAILNYCQEDVIALEQLLPKMMPLDWPRALIRGRAMAAFASIENCGVPLDVETLTRLISGWNKIEDRMIAAVDAKYGVFEGRVFKAAKFAEWLAHNDVPWPRHESGSLDLSNDCFRQMSNSWPPVAQLHELRASLSSMRQIRLAVGPDGFNRVYPFPFQARTGRCQPSTTENIFGPARWIRSLIKPPPGQGIAYIDWSSQEIGIAAALSGDEAMLAAYRSGDVYLSFGKQAGLVPPDASRSGREDGSH